MYSSLEGERNIGKASLALPLVAAGVLGSLENDVVYAQGYEPDVSMILADCREPAVSQGSIVFEDVQAGQGIEVTTTRTTTPLLPETNSVTVNEKGALESDKFAMATYREPFNLDGVNYEILDDGDSRDLSITAACTNKITQIAVNIQLFPTNGTQGVAMIALPKGRVIKVGENFTYENSSGNLLRTYHQDTWKNRKADKYVAEPYGGIGYSVSGFDFSAYITEDGIIRLYGERESVPPTPTAIPPTQTPVPPSTLGPYNSGGRELDHFSDKTANYIEKPRDRGDTNLIMEYAPVASPIAIVLLASALVWARWRKNFTI